MKTPVLSYRISDGKLKVVRTATRIAFADSEQPIRQFFLRKVRTMSRGTLVIFVILFACFFPAARGSCQDAEPDKRLVYAPDILGVDRLFMIVLSAPIDVPKIEVTVSPPDSVTLFDRTPLPAKSEQRRYYFRTLKPAEQAKITLAHPAGRRGGADHDLVVRRS